jgi:hypothetical protein
VCEPEAATAVLRHEVLIAHLINMLNGYGSLPIEVRKDLLNTFSFIVFKA